MKALILSSFYLGMLAAAAPSPVKLEQSRTIAVGQGSANPSESIAPEVQELPPSNSSAAGSKRVKIRYGKYTLPRVSDTTIMSYLTGEAGTYSTIAINMKKPCENCAVNAIEAGLEYANGTAATADNGGWLHHMVLVLTGKGRMDAACGRATERIFSSGNERTVMGITDQNMKTAFEFKQTDTMSAQIELMNLKDVPQDVWLTMTYTYIQGDFPADWKKLSVVWLDVTGCGPSFIRAQKQQKFTLSNTWTSTLNGNIIGAGGHLHDGGTDVTLYHNGKQICKSDATYTKSKKTEQKNTLQRRQHAGHSDNANMPHIESMSQCANIGHIKKGDKIEIDASYDVGKHEAMKAVDGSLAQVMGISLMYVALDS